MSTNYVAGLTVELSLLFRAQPVVVMPWDRLLNPRLSRSGAYAGTILFGLHTRAYSERDAPVSAWHARSSTPSRWAVLLRDP